MPNSVQPGFASLVMADGLIADLPAFSKEAALMVLARRAGELLGQPVPLIHERLRTREALGTTGFGGGAAIPHARLPGLEGCVAMVARLSQPIDWGTIDGDPVDVLVLLLSPETSGADHLKALARISRSLRDPATVPALRAATTAEAMRVAIGGDVTVSA
ncbi:MAG: PTS sugar transporter subunit IIA [Sphingomonadales bacterium]|jgi:PTS system nitrogen regulatory IIA component